MQNSLNNKTWSGTKCPTPSFEYFTPMRILVILLCTVYFLCSCKESAVVSTAKARVTDSFYMSGIEDVSEIFCARTLNDSTVLTLSRPDKAIVTFKKQGNDFVADGSTSVRIKGAAEPMSNISNLSNDSVLVFHYDNPLYLTDSGGTRRIYPNDKKEHLSDFKMGSLNSHKSFVFNGSLYSTYYYVDVAEYHQMFKEPVLAQYRFRDDSLLFVKSHIERPAVLKDFSDALPLFSFNAKNRLLALMYSSLDHIELYDLEQEKIVKKIAIGNKFYKKPAKYVFEKNFEKEGMSYSQNYFMDNFSYESILYLEAAKKYILFFYAPDGEGRQEQKFMGLVLNRDFEKEKYLSFDTRHLGSFSGVLTFSDGSFAMPVYYNHKVEEHDKVKFLHYSL